MTEPKPTLATLPDDVLLLILGNIDTARGMTHLSLTNKRLHHLVTSDGWTIFARGRFPSLSLPSRETPREGNGAPQPLAWDKLSNSLTWQSRAWDRRSIALRALAPQPDQQQRRHASQFHPIIAAHHDLLAGEDLVAWGAGQDVVGRWRRRRAQRGAASHDVAELDDYEVDVRWARLRGSSLDYTSGRDDVTALALVKNPPSGSEEGGEAMGILAGRENGHLALLSTKMDGPEDFGRVLTTFRPEHGVVEPRGTTKSVLTSTSRICSLDIARDGSVAVATQSSLRLYSMPGDSTDEVRPTEVYRLQQDQDQDFQSGKTKNGVLYKAKWMPGGDVLALSVTEHADPIQCLKVTPSGMHVTAAAKNTKLQRQHQLSPRICPKSIEPIAPSSITGGNGNLLLTAWRDGTVRLHDLRSPSPYDAVFQDNVDPWSHFESLLPFGTERFVAGGLDGSLVKIFDFRFPRTYHHSAALPCSPRVPIPPPSQPFISSPRSLDTTVGNCSYDPPHMMHCTFHRLAPHLFYRPNCNLFFHVARDQPARTNPPRRGFAAGNRRAFPSEPGVWSLARGSDLSPHFFVGVAGGVVEASLQGIDGKGDPNFAMRPLDLGIVEEFGGGGGGAHSRRKGAERAKGQAADPAVEAQYTELGMSYSIMETGDGMRYEENERAIRLPPMIARQDGMQGSKRFGGPDGEALKDVWRLDEAFGVRES